MPTSDERHDLSRIVQELMFDFGTMSDDTFQARCSLLPKKIQRWLATHHPDNRRRKEVLRNTNVAVGDDTVINSGIVVSDNYKPLLQIGRRVAIAPNVIVICASDPNNSLLSNLPLVQANHIVEKPVEIHEDCWIGAGAIILPGVTIAQGTIVGAGAVVNRNTDSWCCYAGVPAKKTRELK
jgi:acetyltransferase-like isoleucine patch superfamily enzyme